MVVVMVVACRHAAADLPSSFTLTVEKGKFYAGATGLPVFRGFHDGVNMSAVVTFSPSTGEYLFSTNDAQYQANKLFGAVRCGDLASQFQSSDRFAWRRNVRCFEPINYTNNTLRDPPVPIPGCKDAHKVQLITYSYVDGNSPVSQKYPNQIRPFDTLVTPGVPIGIALQYSATSTEYLIFDPQSGALLESASVPHLSCRDFQKGSNLVLYFGGTVPAPADMTVEYRNVRT